MRLRELFEDAEADIQASARADDVRVKIYNYLYTHYQDKTLPKAGIPGVSWGVGLTGREMGIEGAEDVQFVFGPKIDKSHLRKFRIDPEDEHITDVRYIIAIRTWGTDTSDILHKLISHDGADEFLHEFNHYLDSKRHKGDQFNKGHYSTFDFTPDRYHNDPAELNAFFHNIAEPLLSRIRNYREMGPEILEFFPPLPEDFRTFLNERTSKLHGVFARHWKHISEENKRRAIARLHALFQEWVRIRDTKPISEGYWGSEDLNTGYFEGTVDIFHNPSRVEFMKLMREHNFLRGFLDLEDGSVYVWDGGILHGDINAPGQCWITWEVGECVVQADSEAVSELLAPEGERDIENSDLETAVRDSRGMKPTLINTNLRVGWR